MFLPSNAALTRSSVLQTEVLVLELVAVDGLAPGAVAGSEVSSLAHEVGDDAVEGGALVAEALLSGAESTEVLGSLGDHVIPQLGQEDVSNVVKPTGWGSNPNDKRTNSKYSIHDGWHGIKPAGHAETAALELSPPNPLTKQIGMFSPP